MAPKPNSDDWKQAEEWLCEVCVHHAARSDLDPVTYQFQSGYLTALKVLLILGDRSQSLLGVIVGLEKESTDSPAPVS